MKKTTATEDAYHDFQTLFDAENFTANPIADGKSAALEKNSSPETASFLDAFLITIKLVFLYVPGVAAIHFIIFGFALSFFYDGWFIELFLGMLGIFAASAFMIMLGIGKLRDLHYLKVVLSVFLTSTLAAILYTVLAVLIPGDFFGFFAKITLPLSLLVAYLVKKSIDEAAKD